MYKLLLDHCWKRNKKQQCLLTIKLSSHHHHHYQICTVHPSIKTKKFEKQYLCVNTRIVQITKTKTAHSQLKPHNSKQCWKLWPHCILFEVANNNWNCGIFWRAAVWNRGHNKSTNETIEYTWINQTLSLALLTKPTDKIFVFSLSLYWLFNKISAIPFSGVNHFFFFLFSCRNGKERVEKVGGIKRHNAGIWW